MKHYIYSYVEDGKPYYVGKGKGGRAYSIANHPPLPTIENIHIIREFDDNITALIREWEMISLLQLESEGGMLVNKVKGCAPPNHSGRKYVMSEETKQKLRKPKSKPRNAEHSEKIAKQNRGRKHTKEWLEAHSKRMQGNKYNQGKPNRALNYLVTHPCGRVEEVYNMREFCEKYNLSRAMMCGVAKGKHKQHRGFRCNYK